MKKYKRHSLTLVEIMLVIVLISVIGGALAFNLSGALDRGRAFKTEEMKKKLDMVISLAQNDHSDDEIKNDWAKLVKEYPIMKASSNDQYKDGWGNPFELDESQMVVTSKKIDATGNVIK